MGFGIFFVWALFAIAIGALAHSRGRSGFGFFLLSLFFSPLLGLIVVLVMKNLTEEAAAEHLRRKERDEQQERERREHERQLEALRAISKQPVRIVSDDRPCPYCAEPIKKAAIKCRHCGSDLAQP